MRLGIMTGGGDCPGLNAVIRAAVARTLRTYEGHMLGFENGWLGLINNRVRDLDLNAISGILPRGGTMLGTSRTDPLREGGLDAIKEGFEFHRLDGLLVCGGDGTLSAAAQLAEQGLPIVGIPKTIDNDVRGTDYSFGFDTALSTVVRAVDALHSTAESHDRVIVVEVMGRHCGWLAICAGLAGGADVVVAEGARFKPDASGRTPPIPRRLDHKGRVRYGGVGEVVAVEIEQRLGIETRTVTLGYIQRGGTPTAFDRMLGSRMGIAAVDLAAVQQFGRMVSLQGSTIHSVELSAVRGGPRPVNPELYEAARVFFG